jgi:hypothetical protein
LFCAAVGFCAAAAAAATAAVADELAVPATDCDFVVDDFWGVLLLGPDDDGCEAALCARNATSRLARNGLLVGISGRCSGGCSGWSRRDRGGARRRKSKDVQRQSAGSGRTNVSCEEAGGGWELVE